MGQLLSIFQHDRLKSVYLSTIGSPLTYDIEFARKQVADLERYRTIRALSGATEEFQHVFQLIPLLLHCNHPMLPGFIENAPFGIFDFKLTDYQQDYLQNDYPNENISAILPNINHTFLAINGIYIMGSIASVAQTTSSDLDIWVCHREDLSATELTKLEQKATALQHWAKQFEIDLNLFLMDEMRFRDFRYSESMTAENSGSAQYMLLLDEFYRSAIRLAGKPLLWLHLLIEDETLYEQEVEKLIQNKTINPQEWVDFGGLGKFSANEYFGASLWQLYKGIDAPYKAIIKILLLEAYSWEYPHTNLIASDFKRHLLKDHTKDQLFDPYLEMLERVTSYLTQHKDFQRLDFVRRCFYIKATEDLWYYKGKNWRFDLLEDLTHQWGWEPVKINDLNMRPFWKIRQVKQSYNIVVKMLMLSYRNLIHFARKHNVNALIMPQDISILTRKIYTVFEELPGKVMLINPQFSSNLAEDHITFIHIPAPTKCHKAGWYLVNQPPNITAFSQMRHIEYNPNLHKLVAWAYFNGLLVANTQIYIYSEQVGLTELREFIADLANTFPVRVPPPTNEELHHPCEIRQLMVAVNLVADPTAELDTTKLEIHQSDLFSYGINEQSLVGSIDLIYRNVWNEIRTLHFEGANAILLALKVLSNKIHRGSTSPEAIHVFSYSEKYRHTLASAVSALINKCISIQVGTESPSKIHNLLRVAGKNWKFFFEERGISLQEIPHVSSISHYRDLDNQLHQKLVENEPHFKRSYGKQIRKANKSQYPAELDAFATEGFLQFFFEDISEDLFNVYILDEQNRIEIYRHCDGSQEQKIREINQIYANANADGNNPYGIVQRDFNYPQFYRLIRDNEQTKILPFQRFTQTTDKPIL